MSSEPASIASPPPHSHVYDILLLLNSSTGLLKIVFLQNDHSIEASRKSIRLNDGKSFDWQVVWVTVRLKISQTTGLFERNTNWMSINRIQLTIK